MSHIVIKNLIVGYGEQEVIKDVSVVIPDKQITTILGPSGCGKTSLLKSINRLLEVNDDAWVDGTILVDDEDINNFNVYDLRKKIGFISQTPVPLPMSIFDNVAYGLRIHKMFNNKQDLVDKVRYYLEMAGLYEEVKDKLDEPASSLSVGQKQRLALARALAVEPEVILADEPTSALDPISAKLIEEQFKVLKEKYTIIIVTHILRQARRIADYVIFLYMGKLIEEGPAGEFFNNPKMPETLAYVKGEIS